MPIRRHHPLALALCAAPTSLMLACGEPPSAEGGDAAAGPGAERVNIPVVDQGQANLWTRKPFGGDTGPQPPECPAPTPAPTPAAVPTPTAPADPNAAPTAGAGAKQDARFGTPAQRDVVRGYMKRLMDETRMVADTAARKGGPRGSAGSFAKLSQAQVEEFISAIIYAADLFMPKSLKDEEKWALVACEISIESAFQPGTRGVNPGDSSKVSVSPLQITVRGNPQDAGMWEDIFVKYANIPGLVHLDGSPWDPKTTTADQLEKSIFDGIVASLWCITEQGRRGGPDWFGGPDGPLPKTWHTAQLAWVIGVPALKSGGDLAGQRDAYIASETADLNLLGLSPSLLETPF